MDKSILYPKDKVIYIDKSIDYLVKLGLNNYQDNELNKICLAPYKSNEELEQIFSILCNSEQSIRFFVSFSDIDLILSLMSLKSESFKEVVVVNKIKDINYFNLATLENINFYVCDNENACFTSINSEFTLSNLNLGTCEVEISSDSVAILISQFKKHNLTVDCINSLKKTTYKNKVFFLVDDCSGDYSNLKVFLAHDDVYLISLFSNSDYCAVYNILAEKAVRLQFPYLFIINNDTFDFSINYFESLIKHFSKANIGIVSSRVNDFDGEKIHWRPRIWANIPLTIATEGYIVRSSVWKETGGFNLSYVRYCEDLDLVIRIKDFGFLEYLENDVSFSHHVGASSNIMNFKPTFYYLRNIIWVNRTFFKNKSNTNEIANIFFIKARPIFKKANTIFKNGDLVSAFFIYLYCLFALIFGFFSFPKPNRINYREFLLKTKTSFWHALK
uniref:glycosyltransferase family 2 protein n=1 Tax=Flavobacterium sp. TaxID=239 RepID=UPI00404B5E79